jgi:hypothetical protein
MGFSWDQFVEQLVSERGVIRGAPVIFLLSVLLVGGAVWWLAGLRYSARIEGLEERNKYLGEQLVGYKEKLSGATPDEAKARLDALEAKVLSLGPRRLTADQQSRLRDALSKNRGSIRIAHDMAAPNVKAFSDDLIAAFQGAGWSVVPGAFMARMGPLPRSGLILEVVNPASLSQTELGVETALKATGIDFEVQPGRGGLGPESGASLLIMPSR